MNTHTYIVGNVGLNGAVMVFALGISMATGLVFGLLPSLQVSSRQLIASLTEGARAGERSEKRRAREVLVTVEIALAVVLVIGAGLLMTSFWKILQVIGFTLAWLIDRKFRGHAFWTTLILVPMMLSPAVVGNFWRFLYEPQIGLFSYVISFVSGIPPTSIQMLSNVSLAPWSIIIVDTWMWTPYVMLICLAGLRSIPEYIYEAAEVDRASNWRQFWSITLPMALPFIMLAVLFRGIENFKMFDMVNLLTGGGPGSTTEVASITLKRQAFESWRTGYSSAFAIILFVAVFGLANIYVKALNKVKQR